MPWYGWDDDWYENRYDPLDSTPDAIVIEGPLHAKSKRGDIGETWWGMQWVQAMQMLGGGRLDRGKSYARNGRVLKLTIQQGLAFGPVQGSYRTPYQASIELRILADKEWETVIDALSSRAIFAAKLLAGEMPENIEEAFEGVNLTLFPQNWQDISFECSCPDWEEPCKHAAAIYYLLAEEIDRDPFVLFHLRGATREQILAALRRRRGVLEKDEESAPKEAFPALDADLQAFWVGQPVSIPRPAPASQPAMLARLGYPPDSSEKDLRQIYAIVREQAERWLAGNGSTEVEQSSETKDE